MNHVQVLTPNDWRLWRDMRLAALKDSPEAFGSVLRDWQGKGDREGRWRQRLTDVAFNAVATVDTTQAGMVSGNWHGTDIELMSLWVSPFARGQGIGDLLVETVLAWATGQQARRVVLSVRDFNVAAIRLYRRHGFSAIGPSPESEKGAPEMMFTRRL